MHLQQLLGQGSESSLPVQMFAIEKLEDAETAATNSASGGSSGLTRSPTSPMCWNATVFT